MGIPELWILDLAGRRLEVLRSPASDPGHPRGHSYRERLTLDERQQAEPLALPRNTIAVCDMLPPAVLGENESI